MIPKSRQLLYAANWERLRHLVRDGSTVKVGFFRCDGQGADIVASFKFWIVWWIKLHLACVSIMCAFLSYSLVYAVIWPEDDWLRLCVEIVHHSGRCICAVIAGYTAWFDIVGESTTSQHLCRFWFGMFLLYGTYLMMAAPEGELAYVPLLLPTSYLARCSWILSYHIDTSQKRDTAVQLEQLGLATVGTKASAQMVTA